MTAKVKEREVFQSGNFVCIHINKGGNVIENEAVIADEINKWQASNPEKKITNLQINITTSSGGRNVSVNSITFISEPR